MFKWARGYRRGWLIPDFWAGVTIAAITIPEDMGYAHIAGMPVEAGLYCALLPLVAYVLFGSSRQLNVGADSATALVIGSGAAMVATAGTQQYNNAVAVIALLNGVILLVAGIAKLGFLADFMARSVMVGFLAGVGIQIAVGQLPDILHIEASGGFLHKVGDIVTGLPEADWQAIAVGVVTFVVILLVERVSPLLPAMLVGLIAGTAMVAGFGSRFAGVELVGDVPAGLPPIVFPDVTALGGWHEVGSLLGTASAVAFVVLAQSSATSKSFAAKNGYDVDVSSDLVGLGAANLAAGVTGAFPVNGSVSRTAAMDSARGRTQVAALVSTVCIVGVLLFATGLLEIVPRAALGAVIFLAVIRLVNLPKLTAIWRSRRQWTRFLVVLTTVSVCVLGVKTGVIVAIVVSLLEGLVGAYRPDTRVFVPDDSGGWVDMPNGSAPQSKPGLIAFGVTESLRFYNIEFCRTRLLTLIRNAPDPVHAVALVMDATPDVDYSAGVALRELVTDLQARGIRVVFVRVSADLRPSLDHYGITELIGADSYFASLNAALPTLEAELERHRDS